MNKGCEKNTKVTGLVVFALIGEEIKRIGQVKQGTNN